MSIENFLSLSILAVERGGETLINYFEKIEKTTKIKNKNLRDLVSEVDLLSENEIVKTLKIDLRPIYSSDPNKPEPPVIKIRLVTYHTTIFLKL